MDGAPLYISGPGGYMTEPRPYRGTGQIHIRGRVQAMGRGLFYMNGGRGYMKPGPLHIPAEEKQWVDTPGIWVDMATHWFRPRIFHSAINPRRGRALAAHPPGQAALTYLREQNKRGVKIHVFVVTNVDRFARDAFDHAIVCRHLAGLGITLRAVSQPIAETPAGGPLQEAPHRLLVAGQTPRR
jgi:hypothetical protein